MKASEDILTFGTVVMVIAGARLQSAGIGRAEWNVGAGQRVPSPLLPLVQGVVKHRVRENCKQSDRKTRIK